MLRHAVILPTAAYLAQGATGAPIAGLVKVTAYSILEVVILSSVGFILARRGIIDKKTQTKINKLNVSFFTPALLFSKVAFTLNPARLAELIIVPLGFVIITLVSTLSALLLAWLFRLSPAHRNFAIACAISPNSNSLPVALMQSLVVTVPQLHWDEEGEPEDTVDGMLGRALTYLVLYSTLGMFLRWSVGAKLLSTVDEGSDQDQSDEQRRLSDPNAYRDEPSSSTSANLVDYGQHDASADTVSSPASRKPSSLPHITLRRPTGELRPQRKRSGPPAWARSFPNSPSAEPTEMNGDDVEDLDSDDDTISPTGQIALPGATNSERRRSFWTAFNHRVRKIYRALILKPLKVIGSFMTAPLYAAVISLVVALIPPLQQFVDSLEPVVGALETAGACSIPLTMVVLGAYFHSEDPAPAPSQPAPVLISEAQNQGGTTDAQTADGYKSNGAPSRPISQLVDEQDEAVNDPWRRDSVTGSTASGDSTLVQKDNRRKGIGSWIMKNPWSSSTSADSNAGDLETARYTDEPASLDSQDSSVLAQRNADLNSRRSAGRNAGALSKREEAEKRQIKMERRTIAVAISSRMILTPLILLPIAAWYAIATRYNV